MPSIALFLLIALPWLNPFSPGPTPAALPLLFSWACATVLLVGGARLTVHGPSGRLAHTTAMAWLAAALLSAVLGLLQYFGASAGLGVWVNSTGLGEAFANLRQRNQFASLTNIGLAALLWWVAQGEPAAGAEAGRTGGQRGRTALAVAAAVLLGIGNAASSSRTGLVQLLMLLALAWVWGGWRSSALGRVLLAATLAYALAALALPLLLGLDPQAAGILARLRDGGPDCASRLTLWGNVLHLIAQQPWLGWGWGELDYAHFITLYPGARFCDILDNAHNLPLQLAVELGVPAALLLCGTGVWLVARERPWRERDASRQLAWAVLAVILLHSLLEYPLWYGPFQIAAGLSIGLLWRSPARPAGAYRSFIDSSYALAGIVLVSLAYAAWDYQRVSQIYRTPNMRSAAYREHTLAKIQDSWLFQNQVRFAELTTTPLTRANAPRVEALASALLHFSPEPRVLEKLIESAVLLGHDQQALYYLLRYQAAFPEHHARWARANAR